MEHIYKVDIVNRGSHYEYHISVDDSDFIILTGSANSAQEGQRLAEEWIETSSLSAIKYRHLEYMVNKDGKAVQVKFAKPEEEGVYEHPELIK